MAIKKTGKQKTGSRGTVFVISAPSGAGKSTLCEKLLKKIPELGLSVSYTTRSPRRGEVNDIHYTFISKRKFKGMIEREEFAEWAMVHGNLYGTALKRLRKMNNDGYDIILDIDVNGAAQIRKRYDNAVYIFILPPSMQALRTRLAGRKTETEERIQERLDNAKAEISGYIQYDYIVVNDKIDTAYKELESIIKATKLKTENTNNRLIENLIN